MATQTGVVMPDSPTPATRCLPSCQGDTQPQARERLLRKQEDPHLRRRGPLAEVLQDARWRLVRYSLWVADVSPFLPSRSSGPAHMPIRLPERQCRMRCPRAYGEV